MTSAASQQLLNLCAVSKGCLIQKDSRRKSEWGGETNQKKQSLSALEMEGKTNTSLFCTAQV